MRSARNWLVLHIICVMLLFEQVLWLHTTTAYVFLLINCALGIYNVHAYFNLLRKHNARVSPVVVKEVTGEAE